MKRAYQINERKAIDRFRSYLATNPGNIQLVLPLAELAQRLRHGVSQMLFDTERELLMLVMSDEIRWLSQEQGMARWGTAPGSVLIHGQKVPVERPRVRWGAKEAKLGSYELFRVLSVSVRNEGASGLFQGEIPQDSADRGSADLQPPGNLGFAHTGTM